MYFFRNSLRTLREIGEVLNWNELRQALLSEQQPLQDAFTELRGEMNKANNLVKRLRNRIGGHVSFKFVQEPLNGMPHERKGLIQLGWVRGKLHYKFAGDIILSMMVPGVEEN